MPPSACHIQVGPGSTSPNSNHVLNIHVWNGLEKGQVLRAYLISWKDRNQTCVFFFLFPVFSTPNLELLLPSSADSLQESEGLAEPLSCPVV